jgi:hypothetical protein
MRLTLLLCALAYVCVNADELSDRAVIRDALDQLDRAAPDPEYDEQLIPTIQKCMEPNNGLAPELCLAFIQSQNDFLVAKYRRRHATDLITALLAQTPQLKTIQTETKAY